jgi:hypothetical protein
MIVKRVAPLSVAKVAGIIYAVLGLFFGVFFSMFTLIWRASLSGLSNSGVSNAPGFPPAVGLLFGAGAIVVMPVFYGVMGFVFALIGAALYNVIAGWVGGVELEIQ